MFCVKKSAKKKKILLTGPDKLRLGNFTVTRADSIHRVLVKLTAACISKVTQVVWRPAFSHFASVIFSCGHIVKGVVGGLPLKDNHIAGAVVDRLRVSRSTGDCRNETVNLRITAQ